MEKKIFVIIGALAVVALIFALTARNLAATGTISGSSSNTVASGIAGTTTGPATTASGAQEVTLKMKDGWQYYTEPATLQAGVPVRMTVDLTTTTGCMRDIVIPEFGVRKYVSQGDNVIEFTPQTPGQFRIACSMNMGQGIITVVAADGTVPEGSPTAAAPVKSGGTCGGSGGCGCGMRR